MSNTDPTRSTTPTQPTRRDTRTSSTSSSSRGTERTNSSRSTTAHPAVESAVTRLLVSIKALLECLSNWSTYKATEEEVSDVYVRLGNQFNSAVSAFASFNIDMSELMSVPDELRDVLERCLAEDASPEILEVYLPNVRQIITNLLQGLREKQSQYRRIGTEHRHKSDQPGHERTGSRSSRSSRKDGSGSGSLHRPQLSQSQSANDRNSVSSRRTPASRRNNSASSVSSPPQLASYPEESFIGGFITPITEQPADRASVSSRPPPPRSDSFGASMTSPEARTLPIVEQEDEREPASPSQAPPPQTASQVPPDMKRYSLMDPPVPPPAVVVEAAPSPPPPEEPEPQGPNGTSYTPQTETSPEQRMLPPPPPPPVSMAKSLAALGHGDSLERRASKRFSTYNISKITGGTTSKERSARDLYRRRSQLVNGSAPTQGDLDVLTEGEGEGPNTMSEKRDASASGAARRGGGAPGLVIQPSIPEEEEVPPVPPLPSSARASPVPATAPPTTTTAAAAAEAPETEPAPSGADSPTPTSFQVFLQVGREVKKATIEPGLSLSSLRMLFVDKFVYNPGKENFPAIYIRDPSSGVQYELEDMDEVKEKCLLSLNIEPLDQIKQHIDLQIASLSQDIKELRASVASNRHQSQLPTIVAHAMDETIAPRPSDRQLQNVARRLSRLVSDQRTPSPPPLQAAALQPEYTGTTITSQITGGSVMTEYTSRIVSDLRTQFDEVQNLRRDLGVMRQLYTEFTKQTKDSLGALRDQTAKVRQLASTSVGGARAYIDTGKTKLDERSQNALTRIEELQDNVENVRDDVVKRHVTPKPQVLRTIQTDIETAAAELESLKNHMETIKPMWKKTWAEELQNIVEEQQFLQHQEEFLSDLLEDHKEVVKVFRPIEEFIRLRSTGSGSSRSRRQFRPPPAEEGIDGLNSVMMEIRGAAIDPERRMKAIAANQRNRERDLADKGDEFERELKGFVDSKKLKKTGGAEEAERVRQVRNDMTLKAMFNSGGGVPSSPGTFSGQSSPAFEQGTF